jgi:cell wall assembly regulator SMI1
MSELKSLLARFDSALERFSPGLVAGLPGPASGSDLAALEAGLQRQLPNEIRTLLEKHNGSGQVRLFPGLPARMLSTSEICHFHQIEAALFDARYQVRLLEHCLPDPGWVKSHPFVDWQYHPSRVTIGKTINGDSLVWDGLPGGTGALGQLLVVLKGGDVGLVAASLSEYFHALLDKVDQGLVVWSRTDQDELCWRSVMDQEPIEHWQLLPRYRSFGYVFG